MTQILEKKWLVYCVGFAFFFAVIRYWGFYEDAGRYLLQVINYLHPERFVDDVPFMYGNQDSFTIFSPIISVFYKLFGVNKGGALSTLLLQVLWCAAAISMILSWTKLANCLKYALPIFAICIATLFNKMYGCGGYFPILDYILVARFFSFGLVLFGFAVFFGKNKWISLALFIFASTIHPLTGGWGILLWIFFNYPRTKLPVLIGVFLFPLTGFLHFDRFDFYSSEWSNVVTYFSPNSHDIVFFLLILLFWILMYRLIKDARFSGFSLAMFWVCFVGLFFQCVSSLTGHMLLYQAQPYRVQLISFVPMFPVAAILIRECSCRNIKVLSRLKFNDKSFKIFLGITLIFLLIKSGLNNYVQIALQFNPGDAKVAYALAGIPGKLIFAHKIILLLLAILFFARKQVVLSLVFLFSFFNEYATVLPLIAIVLFLCENLQPRLKNALIAFACVYTFAELLMTIPNNPIQGAFFSAPALFVILFVSSFLLLQKKAGRCVSISILLGLVSLGIWDCMNWDSRNLSQKESEMQMDAFFEKPIFPQVVNRGRMLYAVDGENPLQSRFVFLNGSYADETINVGEIFFKGQYIDAIKRKSALLYGDTTPANVNRFSDDIMDVYDKPDILEARFNYLCNVGEISHLVTQHASLSMLKSDSMYLDVKKKYVYLYDCNR